nr:keratin, type I cytoskeletal 10-like [Zootoca vivipara]
MPGGFGGGLGGGHSYGGGGSFGGGSFGGGSGGFGFGGGDDAGFLSNNEKSTMQNLNDRLASYLDQVRNLEAENNQLEHLIKEWHQKHGQSGTPKDYSSYYDEIDKLSHELVDVMAESNKMLLDIDNTKMAANDFKMKYETEAGLRQTVEADLQGLRPLLDKLTLEKSDLEMEYESLREELSHLKKNHSEVKNSLQHQSGGGVTVEVDSNPGEDLKKRLDDLRHEYEQIIQENRREVEQWYEAKMEESRQQEKSSDQDFGTGNKEVMELSQQYQTLEIELKSQISLLQSLQNNLNDTEGRYNMQLQQIVSLVEPLEHELASIKHEIQNQSQEYQTLLGIKTHLEGEINQYRQLLEEGKHLAADIGQGGGGSSGGSSGGGRSSGGMSYGGSSRGGGSIGQQSPGGISQGGSSRGGGGSGGQQSPGGISQGGSSRGGGSGGQQSPGGISQGGSSRGGGSGGQQSRGGISQGGSSRGGGSGGGQSPGGISQGGSSRGGSGGGESSGGVQSPGGISQGGSSGGRGEGSGGHYQSSPSSESRPSLCHSHSSTQSQSGSYEGQGYSPKY